MFLLVFGLLDAAQAAEPAHMPLPPRIIRLRSPDDGTCASAFLSRDSSILTAAHVAASLCPQRKCREVLIGTTDGNPGSLPEELSIPDLEVLRLFSALDTAVLYSRKLAAGAAGPAETLRMKEPSPGTSVRTAGFPGCGRLNIQKGRVEQIQSLRTTVSLKTGYGISGAPLFDDENNVLGLVSQAAGVSDLAGAAVGAGFRGVRAARADLLEQLLDLPEKEALEKQIDLLLQHYRETVAPEEGFRRLWVSADFITLAQALKSDLLSSALPAELLYASAMTDQYPAALPRLKAPQIQISFAPKAEQLFMALSVEIKGPFERLNRPLNIHAFQESLKKSGRGEKQISALVDIAEKAQQQRYSGFERSTMRLAMAGAILTIVLAIIWSFSAAFVFAKIQGSFKVRLLAALGMGLILWPLPFLLFILYRSLKPCPSGDPVPPL